jgi:hypothetical protein
MARQDEIRKMLQFRQRSLRKPQRRPVMGQQRPPGMRPGGLRPPVRPGTKRPY